MFPVFNWFLLNYFLIDESLTLFLLSLYLVDSDIVVVFILALLKPLLCVGIAPLL